MRRSISRTRQAARNLVAEVLPEAELLGLRGHVRDLQKILASE